MSLLSFFLYDTIPHRPAQVTTKVRRVECAGAYNSVNIANKQSKQRKEYVRLYSYYLANTSGSFRQGSYGGVPSIVSTGCTGIGVFPGTDGGRVCDGCKALRAARGSRNPSVKLDKWGKTLSRCIERRDKNVLTSSDLDDAARFLKTSDSLLSPAGLDLKEEARGQLEYARWMAKLDPQLKDKKYKKIGDDSVPGMSSLFEEAGELYKKNPDLQDSLVVALLKGAVAKAKYGTNAKTEQKVVNFFRYIRTIDSKAAEVMSANLMGPSKRWMQTLDAREREECIFTCGKDNRIIIERIAAAIKRRTSPDGHVPSFGLAIDATKVSQVIEVSSGHKAIFGVEYPNEMIDIVGLSKDKVREILDGESTEHGTRTPASEIKVCIMCCMFVLYLHNMLAVLVLTHTLYPPVSRISQVAILTFQSTPPGIPPSEIVAARPQSNNESNEFVKSMESSVALAPRSLEVKPKVFVSFEGIVCVFFFV